MRISDWSSDVCSSDLNFEQLDYARLPRPTSAPEPFEVPALPQGLNSEPKPHQRDAFAWLAEAWGRKLPGVLLADDMGLGKTFQAPMFLLWLRSNSAHPNPVLIVAPTGLLNNWQAARAQHVAAALKFVRTSGRERGGEYG